MKNYIVTLKISDYNLGLEKCKEDKRIDLLKFQLEDGNIYSEFIEILDIKEE